MDITSTLFTLFLNVMFWSVVAVLFVATSFAVVWLIVAVVLGVVETRQMRSEQDAERDADPEELFDISPL